jgi:hypothetical protein
VASATQALAERFPADARLALFSDNLASTCEAFRATRLGETLCGAEFTPLLEELKRLDRSTPLFLRPAFGLDWSDLAEVAGPGGLAVFPLADGSMGTAIIFADGDPGQPASQLLIAASRYFTEKGFRPKELRHQGDRMTLFEPPAADKTTPKTARVSFVASGLCGIANSQAAAEAILSLTREGSLATEPAFTKSLGSVDKGPQRASDATFFLRPIELWELARSSDPKRAQAEAEKAQKPKKQPPEGDAKAADEKTEEPDPIETSRRLGLGGVQVVAGQLRFAAAEPCEWELVAQLAVPGPYEGALRMLELKPEPFAGPPPWLAADVTRVWRWRWDFAEAMKGFGNLFDEANQPGPDGAGLFEDMLDGLRDDPEGVMVDLRHDLFEHLGPDMLFASDERGARTESQPDGERTLYLAAVRDAAVVEDALARFYKGDDRVEHTRVGAFDVWTVPEGSSLFVEGESDSVVTVRALAVGGRQLFFGTDVDMLKGAIEMADDSPRLRDDGSWSRLLAWITGQAGPNLALWALTRLDCALAPSYTLATKNDPKAVDDLASSLWRVLLFGSVDRKTDAPYAIVPAFDRLRAALPRAGAFVSKSDGGWAIRLGALASETSDQ